MTEASVRKTHIDIGVLTGPPGCGKSTLMRHEMAEQRGVHVLVAPTTELIDQHADALASEAGSVAAFVAHHNAPGHGDTQRRLGDAADQIDAQGIDHAVVLASHQALMGRDLSRFAGARLWIDEAPDAVQTGKLTVSAFPDQMERLFDLDPIPGTRWSEVMMRADPPRWRDLARDSLFAPLSDFVKLVGRQGVYVDRQDWAGDINWCSAWLPTELDHFTSVTVAGASYLTSLGAVIARKTLGDQIRFRETILPMRRTAQPRVQVHFFTRGHEGSSTFWSRSDGIRCIKQVCDHLARQQQPVGFWAANKTVEPLLLHRLPGECIRPKAAGLNAWREENSCALIYSAKAGPADAFLKVVFGLTDADFIAAREDEDIFQFATRGAIRNADYGGPYDIYVYSERQASRLRQRLLEAGLTDVSLVEEGDAGIMDTTRSGHHPISVELRAEKEAERRRRKAEWARQDRAAKAAAAGRDVGRNGRPPAHTGADVAKTHGELWDGQQVGNCPDPSLRRVDANDAVGRNARAKLVC